MVRAESEFGFVAGDAQPTGAKMDHPDHGTHLELDSTGLTLSQEAPTDEGEAFLESVVSIAELSRDLVQPSHIYYAGFAAKHILPFSSEAEVFAASLGYGSTLHDQLADSLGITPLRQEISNAFTSGSYELQISLKSISFNQVRSDLQRGYGFNPTDTHRRNVDRWNAREKSKNPPNGYALILEADLQERNPPEAALPHQFAELQKYVELLKNHFKLTT